MIDIIHELNRWHPINETLFLSLISPYPMHSKVGTGARYVEHGVLDAGLTGFDWMIESGLEVITDSDLLCQAAPRSNLDAGD